MNLLCSIEDSTLPYKDKYLLYQWKNIPRYNHEKPMTVYLTKELFCVIFMWHKTKIIIFKPMIYALTTFCWLSWALPRGSDEWLTARKSIFGNKEVPTYAIKLVFFQLFNLNEFCLNNSACKTIRSQRPFRIPSSFVEITFWGNSFPNIDLLYISWYN